eukprot:COSAG02_NODE_18610_length_929_cov_1.560241_2_plen_115_part_01
MQYMRACAWFSTAGTSTLPIWILPMVRDKSISFGRLWVAINKSKHGKRPELRSSAPSSAGSSYLYMYCVLYSNTTVRYSSSRLYGRPAVPTNELKWYTLARILSTSTVMIVPYDT